MNYRGTRLWHTAIWIHMISDLNDLSTWTLLGLLGSVKKGYFFAQQMGDLSGYPDRNVPFCWVSLGIFQDYLCKRSTRPGAECKREGRRLGLSNLGWTVVNPQNGDDELVLFGQLGNIRHMRWFFNDDEPYQTIKCFLGSLVSDKFQSSSILHHLQCPDESLAQVGSKKGFQLISGIHGNPFATARLEASCGYLVPYFRGIWNMKNGWWRFDVHWFILIFSKNY